MSTSEAVFTLRANLPFSQRNQSSPFVASYTQQGGAGDLFYPGPPQVYSGQKETVFI